MATSTDTSPHGATSHPVCRAGTMLALACYLGRILSLTFLAPDIVEAIVRREELSGLSLERVTKRLPVLCSSFRGVAARAAT